jgi:peroxiredoxin
MKKVLLILLAAGALASVHAQVLRRAPGFALPDSKMKVWDLYDFRGKPLVLEFMQSACAHCNEFAPVLNRVKARYGDRISILSVANPPDNMNTVSQYAAKHQITYPIVFDMGQAAYSYLLKTKFDLPQVFLIDAQGMILKQFEYSPLTKDIFEGDGLMWEIDRMLGPAPPAANKKDSKKK